MNKLLAMLESETWAMRPDTLAVAAQVIMLHSRDVRIDDERVRAATLTRLDGSVERETVEQGFARRGSVAVVGVSGMLSKYASQVDRTSGARGTAYEEIIAGLEAARNASGIRSALLYIDSPGGAVSGVDETYRAIRDMIADGFRVESFVSSLGASGAYYLAAATSRISAEPSSEVGSIGVYTVIPDFADFYKGQGVKVHLVTTGEVKGAGAHGAPVTESHLKSMQDRVGRVYERFVAAVVEGRGGKMTAEDIDKLQGDTTSGEQLVAMGLVDELAAFGSVLERLNGGQHGGSAATIGDKAMSKVQDTNAADASATAEAKATDTKADGTPAEGLRTFDDASLETVVGKAIESVTAKQKAQVTARRTEIRAICEPFSHVPKVREMLAAATADADSVLETNVAQLAADVSKAAAEATKPTEHTGVAVAGSFDGRKARLDDLANVLTLRANRGLEDRLQANGDEAREFCRRANVDNPQAVLKSAGRGMSGGLGRMRLIDIAQECVTRAHLEQRGTAPVFATDHDVFALGASLGTSDFDSLMLNVANKSLLAAYTETMPKWRRFCAKTTVADFKARNIVAMSEAPDLDEYFEGGTPERGDIGDQHATDTLRTWAKLFGLSRKVIINDDLNAFARIPRLFGNAARRKPDDLVFALINTNAVYTGDNIATYDASHNNLDSAAALSVRALQSMHALMMKQTGFGEDEAYIELEMRTLVVPVALMHLAEQIRVSEYDPQSLNPGVTNDVGEAGGVLANTMRNRFDVVASPRLDTTSTTAFYGFADQSVHPAIEVAFLNGNEVPIISPISTGSILERTWEIVHDVSAAWVDPRATVKNAGT